MNQTPCDRADLLVPTRWFHASGDLSRPNHFHQCPDRPLMRSEGASKCPGYSPDFPCAQTCRWCRAGGPPTIGLGASIKSP
jgi:hypothetical protein